jgi:hypothetical protein
MLMKDEINELVNFSHGRSAANGWWDQATRENPYTVPCKLALIHSEISEALEGHRKGIMDDKLAHRPMIEVELADALHRIFDIAGFLGLDLGGAYVEKAQYNDARADHKPENRAKTGGKSY